MNAGEIYRILSHEPQWETKPRAVRWLASRYYAGVDTYYQLQSLAHESIVCEKHGYFTYVSGPITPEDVQEILQYSLTSSGELYKNLKQK